MIEATLNVIKLYGATLIKILFAIAIMWLANKWAKGQLDKPAQTLKKIKKTYGLWTFLLLGLWWILTPSGGPDDFITLFIISIIGITFYIILVGALTAYLIWRMKITIVIYRTK